MSSLLLFLQRSQRYQPVKISCQLPTSTVGYLRYLCLVNKRAYLNFGGHGVESCKLRKLRPLNLGGETSAKKLEDPTVEFLRLSPPERRYADVLGLSDWPRYPDSGLAEPKGNKLHDLR